MKNSQLNRVLKLVRHTGDRMVVMDPETDEVVVMMLLPEYEDLIGAKETASSLSENLNTYTSPNEFTADWDEELLPELEDSDMEDLDEEIDQRKNYKQAPTGLSEVQNWKQTYPWEEDKKPRTISSSPTTKKIVASDDSLNFDDYDWNKEEGISFNEESLTDLPEDEEEERFYLEPVE